MKTIAILGTAALAATLFTGVALSSGTGTQPLPGTAWQLTALGETEPLENAAATLDFGTENQIGGNGGCNTYGGAVTFKDDTGLDISEIFSTMMACPEPAMGHERAFFDALEAAAAFTLANDTLTLSAADGTPLAVFAPVSE